MTAPDFSLTGTVALVTGSSSGIGFAIASALAAAGAAVVLNGRDESRLAEAATSLAREGISVATKPFDVTDATQIERAIAEIKTSVGPIDVLVNNAGTARRRALTEMSEDDWDFIMSTNLKSAFLVTRTVVPGMIERNRGRIINVGSMIGTLARRDNANYSASKAGLEMMTRTLAVELAPHGVRVNTIAPGFVSTPMVATLRDDPEFTSWAVSRTPLGRWGEPEDIGGAAVFLASSASAFVTGQVIRVDGGITIAL